MGKKVEGKPKKEEKKEDRKREDGEKRYPKRKPRGPLFHSGDPTLAERLEEELYDFGH